MGVSQRCLELFLESCRSEHTKKQYQYYLDKFMESAKVQPKDYAALLKIKPADLQDLIADWIIKLKKTKKPNTVQPMLFGVKSFFEANDIDLKWAKLQRLLPEKTKPSGRGAYTLDHIRTMLAVTNDLRTRALILFLASSGVRIGAIPDMKVKHLKEFDDCFRIIGYDDTNKEYLTFITPEARRALIQYFNKRHQDGEQIGSESPLFTTVSGGAKGYIARPAGRATLQEIVRRTLIRAGLRQNKKGNRYDIQIDHGFRKFFNTQVKETPGIVLSYGEMLLGHAVSIPLDNNYLEGNENKLFKEYQKVIPRLTIDKTELLELENQQVKIQAQQKEERINQVIEHYEARIKQMQDNFEAAADAATKKLEEIAKNFMNTDLD